MSILTGMFYDDLDNLFSSDEVIESYSVDYINYCIYMDSLQLYYGMSDDEMAKYMYFYGDRYGY